MQQHTWIAARLGVGALFCCTLGLGSAYAVPLVSVQPSTKTVTPGQTFSVDIAISGLDSVNPREYLRSYDLLLGYDSALLTPQAVTLGQYAVFGSYLGDPASFGPTLVPQVVNDAPFYDPISGNPFGPLDFSAGNPPHTANAAVELFQFSNLCLNVVEAPGQCSDFASGPFLEGLQGTVNGFVLATVSFQVSAAASDGATTWLTIIDDSMLNTPVGLDMKGNLRDTPLAMTTSHGQLDIAEPGTLALLLSAGLVGAGRRALRRRRG